MQGIFLREYIEERAMESARYIVKNKATVRQAAKVFGISYSTYGSNKKELYRNIIYMVK